MELKILSKYVIPRGCICLGDGLYGMQCDAVCHAVLREHLREVLMEKALREPTSDPRS